MSGHGNSIVVGAPGGNVSGNSSGSAYVFQQHDANWVETAKLIPSDSSAGDQFGQVISVSGNHVLVKASPSTGVKVYSFDLNRVTDSANTIEAGSSVLTQFDQGASDPITESGGGGGGIWLFLWVLVLKRSCRNSLVCGYLRHRQV